MSRLGDWQLRPGRLKLRVATSCSCIVMSDGINKVEEEDVELSLLVEKGFSHLPIWL